MATINLNIRVSFDQTGQDEEEEKPRTLFVGNVPREVHKREIEDIFGDIGPLKRCYIQYPREGNEKRKQAETTTVAYVTYALSQDALLALEQLQGSSIGSNKINIKFAKTRSEQSRPGFGGRERFSSNLKNPNLVPVGGEEEKKPRVYTVKKKSRLIVRNLSFQVTEESMREHFEQCGEVKEVNILKKSNGKLVGCAFIQYANVPQAAKALKELNLKPFLGRPIAIDWSLPKEKYQTPEEKANKKNEKDEEDTVVIKEEQEEIEEKFNADDHYAHLGEPMDVEEIKEETPKNKKRKLKREEESSDDDDDDDSDEDSDFPKKGNQFKRPKQLSNDVEEGKTLFLRNLSFDTKEENLKPFFEKFGDIHYALICKDSLTEHPKGTGFVKFKAKSSADTCLQKHNEDPTNFTLNDRQFNVSVALSREKINDRGKEKTEKPKTDGRNLFLVREGFIRPGSGAAADVSQFDMNKRAALNQVKKQMLKNLSIFISPTRLCIHNLPEKFSDKQLKKLFLKHAGPGAKITEARIMRDMNELDLNAKGKSKEYGFVNFADHSHALTALRIINNNPTIFKPVSRPIVEFSMENRSAIKAKEKRAQKSKEMNPKIPKKKQPEPASDNDEDDDEEKPQKKKTKQVKDFKTPKVTEPTEEDEAIPNYAGLVGKKGVKTVPSFKPKGKITRNSLKQKKPKKKKLVERKKREVQVPRKRPLDKADKTEKMISKHKKTLKSANKQGNKKKKGKWYD